MTTVELRDIVTDADREAALAVRRGPGQDRFVASVDMAEALAYAPRASSGIDSAIFVRDGSARFTRSGRCREARARSASPSRVAPPSSTTEVHTSASERRGRWREHHAATEA